MEYARWILAQEAAIPGAPYDSLNQIWAGGPGGLGETNSVLSGISLDNYPVGKEPSPSKSLTSNASPTSTANAAEIQQVLTLMGVDADTISTVSDSIQDWTQPGDLPRIAGAKNDYYQSLDPPYNCKEAPIDDLSELLLVKGIAGHPEIYWGGAATNHTPAVFQHKLGLGNSPGSRPIIRSVLRTFSRPFHPAKSTSTPPTQTSCK